jgi:hypothetical protein
MSRVPNHPPVQLHRHAQGRADALADLYLGEPIPARLGVDVADGRRQPLAERHRTRSLGQALLAVLQGLGGLVRSGRGLGPGGATIQMTTRRTGTTRITVRPLSPGSNPWPAANRLVSGPGGYTAQAASGREPPRSGPSRWACWPIPRGPASLARGCLHPEHPGSDDQSSRGDLRTVVFGIPVASHSSTGARLACSRCSDQRPRR